MVQGAGPARVVQLRRGWRLEPSGGGRITAFGARERCAKAPAVGCAALPGAYLGEQNPPAGLRLPHRQCRPRGVRVRTRVQRPTEAEMCAKSIAERREL